MADAEGEASPGWTDRSLAVAATAADDSMLTMDSLLATLQGLEAELRQREISETSSGEYCSSFCQALMTYAGSRNSVEHGLPLLELYCLSITCFAAARPHLTGDSDRVALVLKRLALSCFELLLSVPESDIPYDTWVQFHRSVQAAHNALLEYGSRDLQALLQILGEGGAWSNSILVCLLTGQPTDRDELDRYFGLEGDGFMEMRVKHLVKVGELDKAMVLAKACADCVHLSNRTVFRQTYVVHLCGSLPSEEAIIEIAQVDGKEVLDIICNLETEGQENLAFILCTTYLTQHLQQESLYCSWELTLLWSKLQKRVDPSPESFLERCLQLGAIAKTVCHLLLLVRVIQAEAEELGLVASVELCVRALQLPGQKDIDTKTSVCKTVACLLPDDLEVQRASQLTEFLLSRVQAAYQSLEDLYLQPDQKYDEENGIIPNSLRCELLLALKAHWPFDPEFWDWKMLKRHCIRLLGQEPEEEEEEEEEREEACRRGEEEEEQKEELTTLEVKAEQCSRPEDGDEQQLAEERTQRVAKKKVGGPSERYLRWQKYKFFCQICQKEVIEARILHHSKKHVQDNVYTCPICLQTFQGRQEFVPHTSQHIQMPARKSLPQRRKKVKKKVDLRKMMDDDDVDDLEPGEVTLDPSLLMYYQSTKDPDVLEHLMEQAAAVPRRPTDDDYITFEYIAAHFQLQGREVYPCPATGCSRSFKQFKYLSVHLKAEHDDGDVNVRHYMEMKDRREKCTFCRRHFMTAYHHRRHRRVHYGDRPYMCIVSDCGARFDTTNELMAHKQAHGFRLSYGCELEGCSLSFCDLGQLYHHEAQHFRDAAYSCISPGCKKFYYSKKEFLNHLASHGLAFSEEDFTAQRIHKRRPLDPLSEESGGSARKSGASKSAAEGSATGVKKYAVSQVGSSSSSGMLTCVAVCFDGKKFTCGFENCGKAFAQARDVQKHLKCVHPAQLKAEKRGHRTLGRDKGSKTMCLKADPASIETGADGQPSSSPAQTTNPRQPLSPGDDSVYPTTLPHASPAADDLIRDILLGLSQLSLMPLSPGPLSSDPCPAVSGSSLSPVSWPPCVNSRPSSRAMQTKASSKSQCSTAGVDTPSTISEPFQDPPMSTELPLQEDHEINRFLVQPSTKPYTCEMKGCTYRSVTSSALMCHYVRKHSFSRERVKGMEVFRTSKFKPFKCHMCPKGYRQKSELRIHLIQMHNVSEAVVEQMSCSVKRREDGRTPEAPGPTVDALVQRKPLAKVWMKEEPTWQQKYQKRKAARWKLKSERENGVVKPEDQSKKVNIKAEPVVAGREAEEERVSREGRGSRRLVAKGNLCYILTNYHKPFHCVHKDCNSAFTNQSGLVRHLQAIHHYNRSQLCLEEDIDYARSTAVRRDAARPPQLVCKQKGCTRTFHSSSALMRHYRRQHAPDRRALASTEASKSSGIPESPNTLAEEPIPQFRCSYTGCNATYHLNSSLLRHVNHTHPDQVPQKLSPQQVHCKFDGCTRVFSQNSSYKKHVFYRHCDYYDTLVLHLQNAHKKDKSESGCQKKLIVPSSSSSQRLQKDNPALPVRHSLRHGPKSEDAVKTKEVVQESELSKVPQCSDKRKLQELVFRTPEEALQMCQDRCLPMAYPCMVQSCNSVLTVESSIRRHYLRCHKMTVTKFTENMEKLVNNGEQLEALIQKKSAISARSDNDRAPNGVLKVEYQTEPENPGGPALPMSLHSIKTDALDGQDPLGFAAETMPTESSMLVGADDVLYGEPSRHTEELLTQNSHVRDEKSRLSSPAPPPLDLSPPSSLRFTVDEGFMEGGTKTVYVPVALSNSVSFPAAPTRQPLKRKNELPEPQPSGASASRDVPPLNSAPRTFDLATYKPMGFESSFLKFIQESKDKEDEFDESGAWGPPHRHEAASLTLRRRDSHRRNSVKENSQRGLGVSRSRRIKTVALKPLLSAGESASVQNLRSILDQALTGCGDLAIKQLQYLRPVVVLERSKFSTSLLDLFP